MISSTSVSDDAGRNNFCHIPRFVVVVYFNNLTQSIRASVLDLHSIVAPMHWTTLHCSSSDIMDNCSLSIAWLPHRSCRTSKKWSSMWHQKLGRYSSVLIQLEINRYATKSGQLSHLHWAHIACVQVAVLGHTRSILSQSNWTKQIGQHSSSRSSFAAPINTIINVLAVHSIRTNRKESAQSGS